MESTKAEELFHRYEQNPIITVEDLPYAANTVFNAGATMVGEETVLLLRVEDRRGISHLTVTRSSDGVHDWRMDEKPTLAPDPENHPEELWGIEDPRITYMEESGLWAVAYTAYSPGGPLVSLATTDDFRQFKRLGPVMPPEDKDAALFPVRFKGRWAMIHRPVSTFPATGAHIWISFSPDLKHWGDHCILIRARKGGWWDANKIGLSPPPLRTEQGWLILYHGVRSTASGSIYRLGLALLDLENPCKVIARSDEWVFGPEENYEVFGDVDKVVFPCGWTLIGDTLRLYYGGADTCIALATASLTELLCWLKKQSAS
ncbi:MAG: glycosidase [Deltaproteobacteria bacterium]|nr:glycosidase [Deltaproteobacteria bacterium]MBW2072687.1 glycosidase [Deltaproteobacteria bacterium]